ncbi:FkbM family methyltransferase [Zavarzinia sp.]|uniref:FkbM family methyltransferase n=1 Tax=Zavarzinia sp. TaxID=2027920 RepID=UPI0035661093
MLSHLKALIESRFPRIFSILADLRDARAMSDAEAEMRLLPKLVVAGETACDIGANRGIYAYWLLRLGAQVFAYEPNPQLVKVMQIRFAKAIAHGRLAVESCALSDSEGELVLHVPTEAAALATVEAVATDRMKGMAMTEFTVPRRRLDSYALPQIDFMKIDVEGHEVAVIDGALEIIGRDLPTLQIEAEERHHPGAVDALRRRLEPFGYEGFFFDGSGLCPIEQFDPARHQDVSALNEAGTGRLEGRIYYNNFIYVARPAARSRLAEVIHAGK